MLDDTSRKVLTVMWNVYRNEPSRIDIANICKKSQRSEDQVKGAINSLVKEEFVLWERRTNTFRVIYSREEAKQTKFLG